MLRCIRSSVLPPTDRMSNQLVVSPSSARLSFFPRASLLEAYAEERFHPQGSVYQRIMDDVIESCHVTFEEDGVNQQTLDDLRKVGGFLLPFHTHQHMLCDRVHVLSSLLC